MSMSGPGADRRPCEAQCMCVCYHRAMMPVVCICVIAVYV